MLTAISHLTLCPPVLLQYMSLAVEAYLAGLLTAMSHLTPPHLVPLQYMSLAVEAYLAGLLTAMSRAAGQRSDPAR